MSNATTQLNEVIERITQAGNVTLPLIEQWLTGGENDTITLPDNKIIPCLKNLVANAEKQLDRRSNETRWREMDLRIKTIEQRLGIR